MLRADEACALALSWLPPPVLGPRPQPTQQRLLSRFDWQVLEAPWVFVFTWFGLGFFSFNSGSHFHADYQIYVACSYSGRCCSQSAVLSCFVPMFSVSPPKVDLPVKVFSSRSVLQEQLCGHQEMFGHL